MHLGGRDIIKLLADTDLKAGKHAGMHCSVSAVL